VAVYLHNLDPFLIEFSSGIGIRWYGLSYVAGFVFAFWLVRQMARRRATLIPEAQVSDLILAVAIGTVIGGRLGYCLFYRPSLLVEFDSGIPFWGLLMINKGGMASHGGMIGITLGCVWFARKQQLRPTHVLDIAVLAGPIGVFFGRIANFINGELYGRACSESVPWAVKFPQEIVHWSNVGHEHHDIFVQVHDKVTFDAAGTGAAVSSVDKVGSVLNAAYQDPKIMEMIEPYLVTRHPSQIYQALMEGAAVFVFLLWLWHKPRKPGIITGWFLVGYAAMRFVGEQFRMPDSHIGYELFDLTRGQWLSVLMAAIGLGVLIWSSRRSIDPMGGWGVNRAFADSSESTQDPAPSED
jgi:phosphatidylglycerol:prolipoprotein diacylglycerol transferase